MLPLNPSQISRLFKEALQLQGAGNLDAAEAKYRTILGVRPKLPEVHFQLGRIALERDEAQKAVGHFETALREKPTEAAIWQGYARAVAAQGDPAATRAFLKKVKAARLDARLVLRLQEQLAPAKVRSATGTGSAAPADIRALIGLLNTGAFAEAEKKATALRARHPDVAIIADILANAQARQGKNAAARQSFESAIRLDPAFAEAHNNYGRFLVETGHADEGLKQIREALKYAPGMPTALLNLGIALSQKGESKGAADALRRAAAARPDLIEAHVHLGLELGRLRDHEGAIAAFRAAIAQGDSRAATRISLAQALSSAGQEEAALETFDAAIAAAPDMARAYGAKALLLQTLGRFDEAEQLFRKAIALEPENGENYRMFIASHKVQPGDPLIAEMQARFDDPGLSDESRMNLGFALAKALEDTKQFGRVFAYLNPANALMRKRFPYDIKERRAEIDGLKAAFAGTDFQARKIAGTTDFAPIFVTGMPRSGTTLVEQILASHSSVGGAGEVGYVARQVSSAMVREGGGYRPFSELSDDVIRDIGLGTEARLRALCPGKERITDKSIQTYMVTGAVRLALPKARMVLVRRDPRDTLVSIYKNLFPEGTHRYGYDLRDLGLYYRMFEEMVDFWREKLPGGFYEIEYEALIANPEEESRKLIAACDLEWEDQCLNFHQNKRRVSTLSVYQVRQPIYRSSAKAWEHYEDDLGALFEALGDSI
ncbi:hypothetical protein JT55_14455 [Rhodovulum sp. NI22]|nr:hypothetical protein JT55_14455 [Rhodovulum sp. NI22]